MNSKTFTSTEQQVLEEIMFHRRDVRGNKFLKKEVPDKILKKILLSASLAPSVGFSQPWEFVIVRDNDTKNSIVESFSLENKKAKELFSDQRREAYTKLKLEGILETPINIAVFYKPSPQPVLGQTTMSEAGEYSVVCAVQNMWLMARALNIGLGWVSIVNPESVKEILKAPPENKLIAYLCVGYVKEFLDRPELEKLNWETRKPIEMAVFQNSYSDDQR